MSRTSIGRTVAWALLALTTGWVLARAVRNEPALASRPDERRQIDDLYAIFKDEVSDSVAANVYEALGNRFQLDALPPGPDRRRRGGAEPHGGPGDGRRRPTGPSGPDPDRADR